MNGKNAASPVIATEKMRWHQARQTVLAETIAANAETPGFVGRDLKAFSFGDDASKPMSMASVSFSSSTPNHIAISSFGAARTGSGPSEWPASRSAPRATASASRTR